MIDSVGKEGKVQKLSGVMDTELDTKMKQMLTRGTNDKVVGMFYVSVGKAKEGPSDYGLL